MGQMQVDTRPSFSKLGNAQQRIHLFLNIYYIRLVFNWELDFKKNGPVKIFIYI